MLCVRNMHDPRNVEHEYLRTKKIFLMQRADVVKLIEGSMIVTTGSANWDMLNNVVGTPISYGAEFNTGLKIGSWHIDEREGKLESAKRTATWDLDRGTCSESDAKRAVSVKGEIAGLFSEGTEIEVDGFKSAELTSKAGFGTLVAQAQSEYD